ncbi:MAG: polysaccharide deacetylase family protein [Psychromonas sp.]|nr:polysaccharide deacetylase family protein [Alteromonadales bacterium]MCP5078721.1 polysaccharide deacetylase family protein [Psychromonas sp.]
MSLFKISLITATLLTSQMAFSNSQLSQLSLSNSTWKFNKKSAYALQHDDYCGGTQGSIDSIVAPALLERGLTASFGVIAKTCWGVLWKSAREHVESGFTLFNHSMRHTPAFKPTWEKSGFKVIWDNKRDVADANQKIKDKTGYTPTFMALPYDVGSDEVYEYVQEHPDLIAMRAPVENNGSWSGNLGINSNKFRNSYKLKVELFHNWSPYWKLGKNKRLPAFLADVIAREGFGIQYMHGVADESYYSVPKSEYLKFLDILKKSSDDGLVWVADAGDIVNYRYAREYCTLVAKESSEKGIKFKIDGLLTRTQKCTELNRKLTAIGDTEQIVTSIRQSDKELAFTQIDGKLQFEYETDKGDIEVLY